MPSSKQSVSSSPFLYFDSPGSGRSPSMRHDATTASSNILFPSIDTRAQRSPIDFRSSLAVPNHRTQGSFQRIRRPSSASTFGPGPVLSHWSDDSGEEDDDEEDISWSPNAAPLSPLYREAWESISRRTSTLPPPNNSAPGYFQVPVSAPIPPRLPSFLQALSPRSKVPLMPTSSPAQRNPPPPRPRRPSTLDTIRNNTNLTAWKIPEGSEAYESTTADAPRRDHHRKRSQASGKVPTTPANSKSSSFLDLDLSPASAATPMDFLDLDLEDSPKSAAKAKAAPPQRHARDDSVSSSRADWPNYGLLKGRDTSAINPQPIVTTGRMSEDSTSSKGHSFLVLTPGSATTLHVPIPPAPPMPIEKARRRTSRDEVAHQFRVWQGFGSVGTGSRYV